jgi:hypothetical protein
MWVIETIWGRSMLIFETGSFGTVEFGNRKFFFITTYFTEDFHDSSQESRSRQIKTPQNHSSIKRPNSSSYQSTKIEN